MASQHSEIFPLDPAAVVVGPRIGLFWPEKASALGALMKRDGQNDPIKVQHKKGEWLLVTGLHRLRGAIEAGLDTIKAIEVEGSSAELALIEASENIHRRDFGPIERALFIREIAELAEERWSKGHENLTPQQIGQIKRWEREREKAPGVVRADDAAAMEAEYSAATIAGLYGWQEEVAESLGLSPRTIRDSLKIHRQLIAPFEAELWELLARSPLGKKRAALMELADIADEETRRLVIDTIVGDDMGEIKSVSDAMIAAGAKAAAGKVRKAGDSKWMDGAGTNLDRLSASGWRQFAPTLVEKIKPSALVTIRDAVLARIAAEGGVEAIGADDA
ncbi:hypothetical protein EAO27_13350 [Sphingopyxis sp. YF1]|uniref:ParB/RepB/Spo0J family partition protein n=1 Tax=Sphingopyxis sp. YF1 TaxID=2482763 RepID=UPI001F60B406|nr:ParB/RepB/Spo0J family partition protein [Sphingopyxis sp. YF1]UNU43594.1 hypothetical protein EAO27_13350 [Sphingopyxis sp. YF1]